MTLVVSCSNRVTSVSLAGSNNGMHRRSLGDDKEGRTKGNHGHFHRTLDLISISILISLRAEFSDEEIQIFLRSHPEIVENFVMAEVELEQLERWMIRRTQKAKKMNYANRKTSLSRWKFCVHADKRQMLEQLTQQLQMKPTKAHVLFELSSCISNAVGADGFRMYLVEDNSDVLVLMMDSEHLDENGEPRVMKIHHDASIARFVASTREPVRFSRGDCDCRFPNGIADRDAEHVLCQAIVYPDGVGGRASFCDDLVKRNYRFRVWWPFSSCGDAKLGRSFTRRTRRSDIRTWCGAESHFITCLSTLI